MNWVVLKEMFYIVLAFIAIFSISFVVAVGTAFAVAALIAKFSLPIAALSLVCLVGCALVAKSLKDLSGVMKTSYSNIKSSLQNADGDLRLEIEVEDFKTGRPMLLDLADLVAVKRYMNEITTVGHS